MSQEVLSRSQLWGIHGTSVTPRKTLTTPIPEETKKIVAAVLARAELMKDVLVAQGKRASTQDIYNRNMVSYHKTTMFHRFGGIIWWRVLIAAGTVNKSMVPPRAQVHLLPVSKVVKADRPIMAEIRMFGPPISEIRNRYVSLKLWLGTPPNIPGLVCVFLICIPTASPRCRR